MSAGSDFLHQCVNASMGTTVNPRRQLGFFPGFRCLGTIGLLVILSTVLMRSLVLAQARPVAHPMTIQPFVTIGYSYVPNGDLNEMIRATMRDLQAQGVPIVPQVEFGNTLHVTVGFLASRIEGLAMGFALGYQYAPSYAGYSDYAGMMRIDGKIHRFEISFVFSKEIVELWGRKVSLMIEPGFCRCYARLVEEARYASGATSTIVWSGGCTGVSARVGFGMPIIVNPIRVDVAVGYGVIVGKYSREDTKATARTDIDRAPTANLGGFGPVIQVKILPLF